MNFTPNLSIIDTAVHRKTPIHRQTIVNRIFQLIAIVSDYQQRDLLEEIPGVTIPYYVVGVDDDLCNEFRMYAAEILCAATFDYPADDAYVVSGNRVSNLARPSLRLQQWMNDAAENGWYPSQAETDFIYEWCNVIRNVTGSGAVLWGAGAYYEGDYLQQAVSGAFIKHAIGFDDDLHEMIHGDFPIPQCEERRAVKRALPESLLNSLRPKCYVVSCAKEKYKQMWQRLKKTGANITASWITQKNFNAKEQWQRIPKEIYECDRLVFFIGSFVEDGPFQRQTVEVGMALALNKPVFIVSEFKEKNALAKMIGNWVQHEQVILIHKNHVEKALYGAYK